MSLPCPACLTPMDLTLYPPEGDGGWSMRCPACGYDVPGDDGDPPTVARWLAGEESGEWRDVDLAAWSRMVAAPYGARIAAYREAIAEARRLLWHIEKGAALMDVWDVLDGAEYQAESAAVLAGGGR